MQRATQERARLAQNSSNIGRANDFSAASENTIQDVLGQLQRASELGASAGDATKTAAQRSVISTELEGIIHGVIASASQKFSGRSLFSGKQTGVAASFQAATDAAEK